MRRGVWAWGMLGGLMVGVAAGVAVLVYAVVVEFL